MSGKENRMKLQLGEYEFNAHIPNVASEAGVFDLLLMEEQITQMTSYDVPCSYCHAPVGSACMTSKGREAPVHQQRRDRLHEILALMPARCAPCRGMGWHNVTVVKDDFAWVQTYPCGHCQGVGRSPHKFPVLSSSLG